MIAIDNDSSIGEVFFAAARVYADNSLLAVPRNPARSYHPEGYEISYAQAAQQVTQLMAQYRAAGYGLGHRVALLLESRPEHMLHKLALNALGVCCIPVNPDYRPGEFAYLLDHAQPDLLLVLSRHRDAVQAALDECRHRPPVALWEQWGQGLPAATRAAQAGQPGPDTPASILYTSGTTGRPKGCVLSHHYEVAAGHAYATRGGLASIREGAERLYNPLPLFHVNASILSFYCMLLTGGCQVQTDRFQPSRWWQEVRQTRATIVHYLGVVVQLLLLQPPSDDDRHHCVRFGFGAGVEPQLHAAFEQRFGMPLLELWGMTEMVRVMVDCHVPRQVGSRAFGRAVEGVQARAVDDLDQEVPDGTPGELVIRHSQHTPRKDFFSEYLDDPQATESAWRSGWFHTGDIVVRDASGMFHFVDRRKNIIRRSGENIAAAEVEAMLLAHPLVEQAAVLAVADELREEEVLACIVLKSGVPEGAAQGALAQALFEHCHRSLAYYKAPGWIWFTPQIPTTGTQKIQKHAIFARGVDPRGVEGMVDLRGMKKRG